MELINRYKLESFLENIGDYAGIFFFVLVVLVLTCVGVCYGMTKYVRADDKKPAMRVKGKVLEKTVENHDTNAVLLKLKLQVEWVVIECENGSRLRLRNMPANQIAIMTGDQGEFMYRGETIYRFDRDIRK